MNSLRGAGTTAIKKLIEHFKDFGIARIYTHAASQESARMFSNLDFVRND